MKLSTRLLFTLIFCAFVLPKAIEYLGGHDAQLGKKSIAYQHKQMTDKQDDHTQKLLKALDELRLRDHKFRECVHSSMSKYFGINNSRGIQSPTELKHLRCDGIIVSSIYGINKFRNLESISLIGSDITNVGQLASLPKLASINLIGGNKNISNIDELSQLDTLKNIQFPDLEKNYCYEAKSVVLNMEKNFSHKAQHNFKYIQCRGKDDHRVARIIEKRSNNQFLTSEEYKQWSDFKTNELWRKK